MLQLDTKVFICSRVRDGAPVLELYRDDDEWQLLCGNDHDTGEEQCMQYPFAHVVQRDPAIVHLPALPNGGEAHRAAPEAPWVADVGQALGAAATREREQRLLADVAEHGFHVVSVTGIEGAEYSYTVGLTQTYGHPELMTFGQRDRFRTPLLTAIVAAIKAGATFGPGAQIENIIPPDFDVAFRQVTSLEAYAKHLRFALWYYQQQGRTEPFYVLQVVWQDKDHRYPWEAGYYNSYGQPVLI